MIIIFVGIYPFNRYIFLPLASQYDKPFSTTVACAGMILFHFPYRRFARLDNSVHFHHLLNVNGVKIVYLADFLLLDESSIDRCFIVSNQGK